MAPRIKDKATRKTYLYAQDSKKRGKAKSITIENASPDEVIQIVKDAIEHRGDEQPPTASVQSK